MVTVIIVRAENMRRCYILQGGSAGVQLDSYSETEVGYGTKELGDAYYTGECETLYNGGS